MTSWLFSSAHRPWKILGSLLLLYAGCRWSLHGRGEPAIWSCEGHPEKLDGQDFWVLSERITAADPARGTLEVEPKGYRVRIQAPPEGCPKDAAVDHRLSARLRFLNGQGFVLGDGARVSPPRPAAHFDLYLVSLPALAVAAALFLGRFRMGPDGFREKGTGGGTHA